LKILKRKGFVIIKMSEQGYQGYENWETWNISLWLSNDEGMYKQAIDIMLSNKPRLFGETFIADNASKALEEYVYELLDEDIIKDKISIHRVNWQEVMMDFQGEFDVSLGVSNDRSVFAWKRWFKQVDRNPNGNYA
jgi:hypothetical protein